MPEQRWKRIALKLRRRVLRVERLNPKRGIEWIADVIELGPAAREEHRYANAIRVRVAIRRNDG